MTVPGVHLLLEALAVDYVSLFQIIPKCIAPERVRVAHRRCATAKNVILIEKKLYDREFLETQGRTRETKILPLEECIQVHESKFIAPERIRVAHTACATAKKVILIKEKLVSCEFIETQERTRETKKFTLRKCIEIQDPKFIAPEHARVAYAAWDKSKSNASLGKKRSKKKKS